MRWDKTRAGKGGQEGGKKREDVSLGKYKTEERKAFRIHVKYISPFRGWSVSNNLENGRLPFPRDGAGMVRLVWQMADMSI
jgi:hypothetical protein